MKIKVTKEAYYNLEFLKPGRIINFTGSEIPSWATLADGIETKKPHDAKKEKPELTHAVYDLPMTEPTEREKKEYLENLLNEGIEKGILIDDSDTKSVDEQISELEKLIKGA